ncbi:MAG: Cj0069 family protein [Gaiellaceae bacterium]
MSARVGILWRAEWDPVEAGVPVVESCKLRGVFAAFSALGVNAEPVVYSDETIAAVRAQLLALDGVLVWVNPIERGRDRSLLDPLLREVAEAGVWVSAHPDVILKLGTKEVLVDTKHLSWGTDARIYRTVAELEQELPARLARGPLVLKQHRGMGGNGVWKVELAAANTVLVQHAAAGSVPERLELSDFVHRCEPYFEGTGLMVEQPFQPRLAEGMIRAYLVHDEVVGFTRQYPRGLMPPGADDRPTTKLFEPASEPRYADLRARLESEWLPALQEILRIETDALPVIWDADFLHGAQTASGEDTYVLCEINVSSTFAFPDFAMPAVAKAAISRIQD